VTWSVFLSVLGLVSGGCALGLAVLAVYDLRRCQARYESLESTVEALRREVALVASISARTGRRVQRVEHEFSDVAERVDVVESRGPASSVTLSLDQAIECARSGSDADELAEQFGLSSGEAELVARLHGRKKSA
jgi:phage shock protein A